MIPGEWKEGRREGGKEGGKEKQSGMGYAIRLGSGDSYRYE